MRAGRRGTELTVAGSDARLRIPSETELPEPVRAHVVADVFPLQATTFGGG